MQSKLKILIFGYDRDDLISVLDSAQINISRIRDMADEISIIDREYANRLHCMANDSEHIINISLIALRIEHVGRIKACMMIEHAAAVARAYEQLMLGRAAGKALYRARFGERDGS